MQPVVESARVPITTTPTRSRIFILVPPLPTEHRYVALLTTSRDDVNPSQPQGSAKVHVGAGHGERLVWDEEQNDRVLRGAEGAIAHMRPGGTVLAMSTASPDYCKELAADAAASGIVVLDCPISGMVQGA